MELIRGKKTAFAEAQRICNRSCGKDYCTLANDGAECPAGNVYYCCNCDVGFRTIDGRAICPYCGFDNTGPEAVE